VIPVYKTALFLRELARRISSHCSQNEITYELILVDDCCPNQPWGLIKELVEADPRIRGIRLARNSGQHYAVLAGFAVARGDWLVSMDGDLQDPPESVADLLGLAKAGNDLVFAGRSNRYQGAARAFTSQVYRLVLPWIVGLPASSGMYFVLRRSTLDPIFQYVSLKAVSWLPLLGAARLKTATVLVPRSFRQVGVSAYSHQERLLAFIILVKTVVLREKKQANPEMVKNEIIQSFTNYTL
jgi:glycosyltransferase involved in cell wall biosynthesis